jgi:glutamyl-tRNA reductase
MVRDFVGASEPWSEAASIGAGTLVTVAIKATAAKKSELIILNRTELPYCPFASAVHKAPYSY